MLTFTVESFDGVSLVFKKVFQRACLFLALLGCFTGLANAQSSQGLVSCKPLSQKTGDFGCWILASEPVGALQGDVYWTLDTFSAKEAAEHAKGPGSTVVDSLDKIWVLTIGPKLEPRAGGTRVAQIGPLPVHDGQHYVAQYMEATLQPGMVSRTHVHSGTEAFYTETGETCLETPQGKQVGRKGVNIIIPEGVPMELVATGSNIRKGLMLVLHDASKPATTPMEAWRSKKLCGGSQTSSVDFTHLQLR